MKTKTKKVKRKVTKQPSNGFVIQVEDFLPMYRKQINPELRTNIINATGSLQKGQSFFIPQHTLSISSVRLIMRDELTQSYYKNKDIRVVASKDVENKGCRIARFL